MLYRLFLFLFVFVSSVYGGTGDFSTDFPIYVQGDAGYIAYFLNAAAMLAQDDGFLHITEMAIMITVIVTGLQTFKMVNLSIPVKATATTVAGLSLMLSPCTVHVSDTRTNLDVASCGTTRTYIKVDNVPYIIAFPASVTSALGDVFQQLISTATAVVTNATGNTVNLNAISPSGVGYGGLEKTYKAVLNNARLYNPEPEVARFNKAFKMYLKECVWDKGITYGYVEDGFLIDPKGSWFYVLKPSNVPNDKNGNVYANEKMLTNIDGNTSAPITCGEFWNNEIDAHYNSVTAKVINQANKFTPQCLNINQMSEGMQQIGWLSISDSNETSLSNISHVNALKSFVINKAAQQTIIDASTEYGGPGVDLANKLTLMQSDAKMQAEGAGAYKFFVDMLPKSMHFFYGIVLFLGLFVGISALAQTYDRAIQVYKMYFLSFFAYEAVKISMTIVSNGLTYFESAKAVDKLAAMNLNGASFANYFQNLNDIADMTAVGSTIGTMLIFAIPSIIMRGDFMNFLGSLGAPGQKYLGNDVDTSRSSVAERNAADIAQQEIGRNELATKRLKHMGFEVPAGIGALDYYNQIQSQMSKVSQSAAAMENMGSISDQSKAVMAQAQKQISANAQLGATVTNQQATDSGIVAGAGMAGAMKGDSALLNKPASEGGGVSLLEQAAKTSTIERGVGSTMHSQNIAGQFGGSDLNGFTGSKPDQTKLENLSNEYSKQMSNASSAKDRFDITGSTSAKNELDKTNQILDNLKKQMIDETNKTPLSLAQMMSNNDNLQLTGQIGGAQSYQNMMKQSGGADAGFSKLQEAARVNSLAGMVKSVASTEKMTDKWGGNLADEVKGETFVTEGESSKEDVAGLLKKKKKGAITTNSDKLNAGVADGSITKQDLEAIEKNYGNALSDYDKKEIGALKAKAKVGTRSEKESTDFAEAQGLVAQKEQDGLAGQAFGIKANYGVNPNMYQQNAQYSEMSQQQTTNAKIQTQGGVNSAVGFDVRDSTIKASGQMGSIEGTEKAFKDVGKELVEGLRQVTRELTENAKKGEIGQSQGLDYAQSKKGENFAVKTGQSSAENQAFGALAAIGQAGGVHALAGLEAVKSAAGVSGLQGSIKGAGGAGKYIKQAFRVADAQSQATAGEIATADIFGGGYENYKRNQAIQNTTQSASSVLELQKNLDDQNFLQNKMDSLQKADPELKLDTTFKDKDGKWKTGLNHLAAVSASQVRKSTMKDSFVDDSGKTIDLALGTDGKVNKLQIDGQQKIVDGQTKDMGYNMQAVAEAWNLKNVNDAGMQVQYDEKSGQFKGSQKALKGFGAYYDQVKKAGEGLKEIPAELVVQTGDAAVAGAEMVGADAVASHLEEHGAKYGVGIGGAFLANKIMGNPAGKLRDKLGGLKKSSADKSLNKSDDSSQSQESDKTVKNSDTHVNSSELNNIDNINTNIEKNQTEFKATSSKMKSLEKAEQGLQSSISKQEANLKALKDSGAPATRITEAEERLAQTVEKHDGISSSLNETREKMTSLANEFDNLQGSKIGAEKAFLNAEAPKSNPTMMQKASEAFSDNFAKGFTVDNLKAVGKASLPALAVEAGAQGMQYVANNTTGNTQKVAQVGVDAMNSDTAQYAATGGILGAAIGGVAGFFGGFGVGALPGAAAGATIGTNLGASVGLLKDSLDGSLQAGNQNIRNGFNGLMNMAGDFGSSVSNSINQGFNSATNQLSNIDVSQSFNNFMNNMGFGNSNISSAASSALYSQPSSFQGVNMMNSYMMPQMLQQNNEPGKGGVFDPTTTLSGMQNMAHTQNQQMASQMIQGEVYNASGQIDMVKNMLDKLVKNPPNVSQEDVENLKKQQAYIRSQMN